MSDKPTSFFYGWYVLAASFMVMFICSGIGLYTFPVFLLPLEEHFETTRTMLASVGALLVFVSGLATPFIGIAVHRWGVRAVIGWGAFIGGVAYVLLGLATQFWQLLLLGVPVALSTAATAHIPNQTLISTWFERHRGAAMGVILMASALGGVFWAPAAHEMIISMGWQRTYMVFGVVILLVILPVNWLVLRNDPQAMNLLPDGATEPAIDAVEEAASALPWTLSQVFRTSAFWCLFAVQLFFLCGFSIANTHIVPVVMNSPLGLAAGEIAARELGAAVISYYLMVSIFGAVVAGVLADRLPKKWIMFGQCASLFVATLMLFDLSGMPQLYAFALFFGLAFGGFMVVFSLLLVDVFGVELFSRIMGIMGIPFMLGMALGPLIGGFVYDQTGNYNLAFTMMLVMFAVSAALVMLVREPTANTETNEVAR